MRGQLSISLMEQRIFLIRGQKVMIDRDLAELYRVPTFVLNQSVRRNRARFPDGFMFRLSREEARELITNCDRFATLKHSVVAPWAFTEYGVAMLSSVLRSKRAIQINIQIIQTFIHMRHWALTHKELSQKINEIRLARKFGLRPFSERILIYSTDLISLDSAPPKPRPAREMGDGEDHNRIRMRGICDRIGKPRKQAPSHPESLRDARPRGPQGGSLPKQRQGPIHFDQQLRAQADLSGLVPIQRGLKFLLGVRMELKPRHSAGFLRRACMRLRDFFQSTSWTAPSCTSSARRATSAVHAADAPSSEGPSRLVMIRRAIEARSAAGRFKTEARSSFRVMASFIIACVYAARHALPRRQGGCPQEQAGGLPKASLRKTWKPPSQKVKAASMLFKWLP